MPAYLDTGWLLFGRAWIKKADTNGTDEHEFTLINLHWQIRIYLRYSCLTLLNSVFESYCLKHNAIRQSLENAWQIHLLRQAVGGNDHEHADHAIEQTGGGGKVETGTLDADAIDKGFDDVGSGEDHRILQYENLFKTDIQEEADLQDKKGNNGDAQARQCDMPHEPPAISPVHDGSFVLRRIDR